MTKLRRWLLDLLYEEHVRSDSGIESIVDDIEQIVTDLNDDGYSKGVQDFYDKVLNFENYIEPCGSNNETLLYSGRDITNMIVKIKKEL